MEFEPMCEMNPISSMKMVFGLDLDDIQDVIYNNPATIVKWKDGSKTVVKVQEGDIYRAEDGLARCIIKKMCGNKGSYNNVFKKWCNKSGASKLALSALPIGTKVKIITTTDGCRGAEGSDGVIIDCSNIYQNGLFGARAGINIDTGNTTWRINSDATYEIM